MGANVQTLRCHGVTMLYTVVAIVVLTGIMSFGIDFAHVQLVKTELQRAADAAARYGAAGLSSNTVATKAIDAADDNTVDGTALAITASNVTSGNWDSTLNPAFDSTRTPVNAVKVTISRTVNLLFAAAI